MKEQEGIISLWAAFNVVTGMPIMLYYIKYLLFRYKEDKNKEEYRFLNEYDSFGEYLDDRPLVKLIFYFWVAILFMDAIIIATELCHNILF